MRLKIKPATIRLRANSFMHGLKVLAGDLTEGGWVDAEFRQIVGARAATSFDSSADSICSPKDGECAAKETRTD
ncbi:hypothetical protein CUJ84_Chr004085 [Rhizobium leguminosarum]|uniref:Uncharacterized protein n=1 Tax=Rhizobium leguminosarum TaxID=384 RepID=A0A2K9Z825_RHILE|nr:hypothetical protein CUJ84_Chr004085 [Rhizobium leguminosarum]